MSSDGPYREDSGFAEKQDVLELQKEVTFLKAALKQELARLNFIWMVVGLVSCVLWVAYYVSTDGRLVRHETSIQRIAMRQSSPHVERGECRHRQEYMLDKQETASDCATLCLTYLNTIWPEASESADQNYNRCLYCLMSVRRPMPFEVAHPEYGHIRRH